MKVIVCAPPHFNPDIEGMVGEIVELSKVPEDGLPGPYVRVRFDEVVCDDSDTPTDVYFVRSTSGDDYTQLLQPMDAVAAAALASLP